MENVDGGYLQETAPAITGNDQSDSSQAAAPHLKVRKKVSSSRVAGVAKEIKVTLSRCRAWGADRGASYFSRGKEPKTAYNTYRG